MHRGGVRHGSSGRGGRRGRSRHPSGLSGKEIGLWYAARSKEKKKKREITERDVVTMSSCKEEKISQLLEKLQDKDAIQSSSLSSYSGQPMDASYNDIHGPSCNPSLYNTNERSHHHGYRHHTGYRHHHGNRHHGHMYYHFDRHSHGNRHNYVDRYHHGYGQSHEGHLLTQQQNTSLDVKSSEFVYNNSMVVELDGSQTHQNRHKNQHEMINRVTESIQNTIKTEKSLCDKKHLSWQRENQEMKDTRNLSGDKDDDTVYSTRNDQLVEGDALCMFDELGATTGTQSSSLLDPVIIETGMSLWPSPFGNDALQRDEAVDEYLKLELIEKSVSNRKYIEMQTFRAKLPSYDMKEELLNLINKNQVVVISGETGCGKTTQVAQFILDYAIMNGQGSLCRIACTQPRRISAVSVAERVASERGEPCGGLSVGYQIRLESKLPRPKGSIIYCTTGVLLRWLISDGLLHNISHVIIDEIHERDLMSDFLLIIVRDLLPRRPDLKLILMSATLNAEMFSSYFDNCPMAHIPGFAFPVKEFYFEDVVEMTRYELKESSRKQDHKQGPKWKRKSGVKSWAKNKRVEKMALGQEEEEHQEIEDEEVKWKEYLSNIRTRYSPSTMAFLENMDFEKTDEYTGVNVDLIVKLITHICSNLEQGAILVFLPGWDNISTLHDSLKNTRVFSSDKYLIIPLHSMMPTASQHEVFDRPPIGVRKIVLATNIAETSITIDDVVFVIDCGKVKEKSYDVSRKISCLKPVWISKASARQRRGRAGRVQSGYCFHLFTEFQSKEMIDYQLPEMLRTPLEELCLQIKILKLGMVSEFLSKALQPPSPQAVQNALDTLKQLNALDCNECLTPLGYHLASLPVDPRIGKMILFGAIFSCLDPVLTIASTLGFKEPFVCPLNKKKEADRVRVKFAGNTRSDHLAILYAYNGWEKAKRHNNDSSYCWENFLSKQTLKMLSEMKLQFARLLCDIGFLDSSNPKDSTANHNSDNLKLVKAVMCAGLYPNVVKIDHHAKLKRPPKMFTREDGKVAIHPKSVNFENVVYENNWLIYHQKMKSSKVFIHDTTMISPYPLLFFGGDITVLMEEGREIIAVDDFIRFRSPRKIANLVKELRAQLDKLLERKICQPDLRLTVGSSSTDDSGSLLLHAIIDLITSEESKNWKRCRAMEQEELDPVQAYS